MKKYPYVYVLCVLSIFWLLLVLLNRLGYTLYVSSYYSYHNIILAVEIATCSYGWIILYKRLRYNIISAIVSYLIALFLILVLLAHTFFIGNLSDCSYTEVKSPDENHTIIFYEYNVLLYNEGVIYEKLSPIFIREIGTYNSELRPAPTQQYTIDWSSTGISFTYTFSYDVYKTLTCTYAKH